MHGPHVFPTTTLHRLRVAYTGSGDLSLNTLQLTNKQLISAFIVTKTAGQICYLQHTQSPFGSPTSAHLWVLH